jgi:thioredoxin reductase
MFDVVVVGGGPAGLSAALMLGRCRRRVLVCDLGEPRNRRSRALHGYLSRDGIAPREFVELGREELTTYGIEFRCVGVTGAAPEDGGFRVHLSDGRAERSRFLLIATGVVDALPAVTGVEECYGRSVFHCPYCDGWEWRDRPIAALGSGTAGAGLALGLLTWSRNVVLCTNGRAIDARSRDRLVRNGVTMQTEAIDRVDHDDGMMKAIVFRGGEALSRDVLFFTTGQHPQSEIAVRLGCTLSNRGTVKTGIRSDTNIDRVFVAGDASRDAQFVVVAASEGVKAAVAINKALQAEELR